GLPTNTEGPLLVGNGAAAGDATRVKPAAAEDDAIVPIAGDDATRGSRRAPVTIVVFSDFQCPFCGRVESTFEKLRDVYGEEKLRIVFKNNPLPFHPHARRAAEVGQGVLALGGSDAFWRYHALAFQQQAAISPESIIGWATAAGVEAKALEAGLEAHRWSAKIDRDVSVAH